MKWHEILSACPCKEGWNRFIKAYEMNGGSIKAGVYNITADDALWAAEFALPPLAYTLYAVWGNDISNRLAENWQLPVDLALKITHPDAMKNLPNSALGNLSRNPSVTCGEVIERVYDETLNRHGRGKVETWYASMILESLTERASEKGVKMPDRVLRGLSTNADLLDRYYRANAAVALEKQNNNAHH